MSFLLSLSHLSTTGRSLQTALLEVCRLVQSHARYRQLLLIQKEIESFVCAVDAVSSSAVLARMDVSIRTKVRTLQIIAVGMVRDQQKLMREASGGKEPRSIAVKIVEKFEQLQTKGPEEYKKKEDSETREWVGNGKGRDKMQQGKESKEMEACAKKSKQESVRKRAYLKSRSVSALENGKVHSEEQRQWIDHFQMHPSKLALVKKEINRSIQESMNKTFRRSASSFFGSISSDYGAGLVQYSEPILLNSISPSNFIPEFRVIDDSVAKDEKNCELTDVHSHPLLIPTVKTKSEKENVIDALVKSEHAIVEEELQQMKEKILHLKSQLRELNEEKSIEEK